MKSRNRIRICAKFFFIYMRANLILYVYAVAADAALKRHKPATASASHHRTAEIGQRTARATGQQKLSAGAAPGQAAKLRRAGAGVASARVS